MSEVRRVMSGAKDSSGPRPGRPGRVLVVDDVAANVTLLERILERAGYRDVATTSDPTEVVSLYEDFAPDLILLDLHMPQRDGFEVMEALERVVPEDDYLPILVLTGDVEPGAKARALSAGAKDFLTKPFDQTEVLLRINNLLETRSLHVQVRAHRDELEATVQERTRALWRAIADLERARDDLRKAHEETVGRLAIAGEYRDEDTAAHVQRMSAICAILARALGESDERVELIRLGSQMHDVGKIGTPDSILLKPGSLTPDERREMERHAEIGYRILGGSRSVLMRVAATIAWTHHERVDGDGYPRGLRAAAIPIEGRIAAVADVFDALTSDRIYRPALPLPDALAIMKKGRGSHFDPRLVDAFFDCLPEIMSIREHELTPTSEFSAG